MRQETLGSLDLCRGPQGASHGGSESDGDRGGDYGDGDGDSNGDGDCVVRVEVVMAMVMVVTMTVTVTVTRNAAHLRPIRLTEGRRGPGSHRCLVSTGCFLF